jgi:hypothetical protein
VKSFDAVLDRQIGRKFVGSLASPFLYISVIDPKRCTAASPHLLKLLHAPPSGS